MFIILKTATINVNKRMKVMCVITQLQVNNLT